MSDQDLATTVRSIDRRLQRVEPILPTLATKADLEPLATREEIKALASKEDIRALATKEEIRALATEEKLQKAVARLVTKEDLREVVARLATKEELREAVARFATKEELREAVERLEAKIADQARGFRDVVYEAVRQAWAEAQRWAKVALESMRDAIKVLAESTAGWSPAVERVDPDSKARDDALDRRILALEAHPSAAVSAPRRPRRR